MKNSIKKKLFVAVILIVLIVIAWHISDRITDFNNGIKDPYRYALTEEGGR